jgi:hypothetical protein
VANITLIDGRWDIQLWADNAKPISAKVYRLRIKVPAELIGEVAAVLDCICYGVTKS